MSIVTANNTAANIQVIPFDITAACSDDTGVIMVGLGTLGCIVSVD
jgi:hypothetical protein